MNTKQQQRALVKARCSEMSRQQKNENSIRICYNLLDQIELEKYRVIMSYNALENEPDLDKLNSYLSSIGKIVCYPVMEGDTLKAYLPKNGKMVTGSFSVRQPDVSDAVLMDKSAIELVLVPCVGFDEKLHRLGHGKGYYDRFLEDFNGYKMAVAFEAQKLAEIEVDEHDVSMDKIVTERETYRGIIEYTKLW